MLTRGGPDSLSLWRAATLSLVIAAALLIPYYALQIYDFWNAAPGQGVNPLNSEDPNDTPQQRLETALRVVMVVMPIMIAAFAFVLFSVLMAPMFLLGRIVRRYLRLPLSPSRR